MSSRTRRTASGALVLAVCTALLCACSGGTSGGTSAQVEPQSDASVVSRLGAVPIPSPPPGQPTPVATRAHPQLLAMGAPVTVDLPSVAATVTSFGPFELTPYTGGQTLPTKTVGIITLTVTPTRGSITLRAADLFSRDQTGAVVALAPAGPAQVTASVGHPAKIRVKGTFRSGAAEVSWRYQGRVLVIWDFNIELD